MLFLAFDRLTEELCHLLYRKQIAGLREWARFGRAGGRRAGTQIHTVGGGLVDNGFFHFVCDVVQAGDHAHGPEGKDDQNNEHDCERGAAFRFGGWRRRRCGRGRYSLCWNVNCLPGGRTAGRAWKPPTAVGAEGAAGALWESALSAKGRHSEVLRGNRQ